MQTTLARRQRRRKALGRRPQGHAGTTFGQILFVVLMVFVLTTGLVAGAGALVAVNAYNKYAAGLPDPVQALTNIDFEQQTIIYDRTGKIELARLGDLKRELVTFDQLPGEILDATTSIEDKDFWSNPGFDPIGILSAGLDTLSGKPRGASTITQQLVRARLLPAEAFEGSTYERKAREIIQSIRLTQALPAGDAGKQQIITAYLNQNFYGNQSYGVKAAAKSYFGKTLDQLTLAQDAILAAIPQSPTKFDLVRNADEVCLENVAEGQECTKFKMVVPPNSEIVQRRNHILDLMKSRSPLTGNKHTPAEYEAAKEEPAELHQQISADWKAPHFVWQVRRELGRMYCPDNPNTCPEVDTAGYRVITSLDWQMQQTAEKWVYVAARAPNSKDPAAILSSRKIPKADRSWILGLRGHNINNAAAAVTDYRTGEVLAYVGSASYTSKGNKKFQPQFDVLADGWRQPGSAIKPVDYAIGIDDKTLTASTILMDVTTNFGGGFIPIQADKLERGPVRLRSALQFSLNIPAIKATIMSGLDHVYDRTKQFGLSYPKTAVPVLSMGIGTLEVHPIDLLGAYNTIANGGVRMPRRVIDQIIDFGRQGGLAAGRRRTQGDPGDQPGRSLCHHRHPRRQHRQDGQPVLGQVGHLRGQDPTPRRLQDRHDERQPRRGRLRLRGSPGRHECTGHLGRGLDGQQRQQSQRRQALARYLGAPLVVDHPGGHRRREDRHLQAARGRPDRHHRRVHRVETGPVHDQEDHRVLRAGNHPDPEGDPPGGRLDRRRHGAAVAGRLPGAEGHQGLLQPVRCRVELPCLAEGQRRVGSPCGEGLRRPRWAEGHPDRVLLQRFLHAVRADMGRAVHAPGPLSAVQAAGLLRPVHLPGSVRVADRVHPTPD